MADPQQAYPPGSYPPEQQGYPQEPPPQQAYPQEAYPQQPYPQQAYPQQAYPQQPYPQQPYPQQPYPQQAYPPQAGYPPDYKGAPPAPYLAQPTGPPPPYYGQQPPPVQAAGQQQQSANVVVLQHQPQPAFVAIQRHAPGDQGMVLAVIATFIVVFFGCWFSLACTIPAIVLASNAQTSATTGDDDGARHNRNFSYGLSTAGLVSGIAVYLAWIIYVIVLIT